MEIFGLNVLKSAIIIIAVLLYWKFVYYRYHKKRFTPITFFIAGGALSIIGFYFFLIEKSVSYTDISIIFPIFAVFAVFSFSLLAVILKKHKLCKDIDITLTWAKRTCSFAPAYLWMILAIPVFFLMMISTYRILGDEHFVFWFMVLLA